MKITVANANGYELAAAKGAKEVNLFYNAEYKEGDQIIIDTEQANTFCQLMLDDALGHSLVFLTGPMTYTIPFGEKRVNMSPKVFFGDKHLLSARVAKDFEIETYRNLAINVNDQHGDTNCYPHASANVETRGESVFAAMNAIDGVTISHSHGEWPFESWGINRQDDAVMKLEFGRKVVVDRIVFYTRADYPHDNWWVKATIGFSDGSNQVFDLVKTGEAQEFVIDSHTIEWMEIKELIKADDPSPFPALTQIEVYGNEAK